MRLYDNQPSGTVARARQLRRDRTKAEDHLLRALKEAFPNMKWRFQTPVGPYYADFLCFGAKLIVEVDGGLHGETEAYDKRRTRFMQGAGFHVLRFWNNDVLANVEGVIAHIQNSLSPWEREGAAQRRKGEGDTQTKRASRPSPTHPLPPSLRSATLSHGEGE